MSLHVEYANPEEITFVNELDLVEKHRLSFEGKDRDVLCIWYDELVVIPIGDAGGALGFAQRIIDLVESKMVNGRAPRVTSDEEGD